MDIEIEPTPSPKDTPEDNNREREEIRAVADLIAKLLDSAFYIPGTNIRIGLDPLLGLIPGIGDLVSNLIGSSLLVFATRLGVPRIVIFRMALNIFTNMLLGAIPGVGDLFSIWFRSNIRNAQLLRRYCKPYPPTSTIIDWVYVIGLIIGMLIVTIILLFTIIWLIAQIWQLVT